MVFLENVNQNSNEYLPSFWGTYLTLCSKDNKFMIIGLEDSLGL